MAIPFKPADPTIDGVIAGLAGPRAAALMKLREIIHDALPNVSESVKRKQPHFDLDGPVCFVKVHPSHLNLLFTRGDDIDDPEGVLKSFGKDKIRYIKVHDEDSIDERVVSVLVRRAAALNQVEPSE